MCPTTADPIRHAVRDTGPPLLRFALALLSAGSDAARGAKPWNGRDLPLPNTAFIGYAVSSEPRMSNPSNSLPRHKDDFDRVYNVEDPSPYFTALRPSDYRMPAVVAGALKDIHRP